MPAFPTYLVVLDAYLLSFCSCGSNLSAVFLLQLLSALTGLLKLIIVLGNIPYMYRDTMELSPGCSPYDRNLFRWEEGLEPPPHNLG